MQKPLPQIKCNEKIFKVEHRWLKSVKYLTIINTKRQLQKIKIIQNTDSLLQCPILPCITLLMMIYSYIYIRFILRTWFFLIMAYLSRKR